MSDQIEVGDYVKFETVLTGNKYRKSLLFVTGKRLIEFGSMHDYLYSAIAEDGKVFTSLEGVLLKLVKKGTPMARILYG